MRCQYSDGPTVQGRCYRFCIQRRDANDRRDTSCPGGKKRDIRYRPVKCAMFLIDHNKIEPCSSHYFNRGRPGDFDKAAFEQLCSKHLFPKSRFE